MAPQATAICRWVRTSRPEEQDAFRPATDDDVEDYVNSRLNQDESIFHGCGITDGVHGWVVQRTEREAGDAYQGVRIRV